MLEKLPSALGHALRGARPGLEALVYSTLAGTDKRTLQVRSSAFDDGVRIPARYTADGEGVSPPLQWTGVPTEAVTVVVLIEDADSPTPQPLVHAIAWNLPGVDGCLAEGALRDAQGEPELRDCGLNSYFRAKYLPPDPPPGHGPHRYAFEVFALDRVPRFRGAPGRTQLVEALQGSVIARGMLVGTYERV